MFFEYPVKIEAAKFLDLPALPPPRRPSRAPVGRSEVGDKIHRYELVTPAFSAVSVKLKSRLSAAASTPVKDPAHPEIASGAARFCFAPRVETVDIEWTIKGQDIIEALALEVFPINSANAIYSTRLGRVRGQLLPDLDGPQAARSAGLLAWNGAVNTPAAAGSFPRGFLTVAGSPYKLKLTVFNSGTGRCEGAEVWTYFDVRVHELELDWGEWTWVDQNRASRPDIGDAYVNKIFDQPDPNGAHLPLLPGLERYAFDELKRISATPGANGAEHEVLTTSNSFIKRAEGGNMAAHSEDQKDFNQYKDMWGHGPRIPLLVKAWIRQSDGTRTDAAVEALDGCKIIWDWQDNDAVRWRQALTAGAGGSTNRTERFLQQSYTAQAPNLYPLNSNNCLKDYGGKYGSPNDPVFPGMPAAPPFEFRVQASGTPGGPAQRNWAAFSGFGTGVNGSKSAVIFQPSRMAGDRYKVDAYLYFDPAMDDTQDIDTPPAVKAAAGTFRVFRRVDVFHITRGSDADRGAVAATCRTNTKTQYRKEMHVDLNFVPHPVTQGEYTNAIDAMILRLSQDPEFLKHNPYPALTLSKLIDRVAPDNCAVSFVDWPAFQAAIRQAFQVGMVYRVRLTGGPFLGQEQVQGGAATGQIIAAPLAPPSPEPLVLVPVRAQQFVDDEAVHGVISHAAGNIRVLNELVCWGVTYTDHRLAPAPWVLTAAEQAETVTLAITANYGALPQTYRSAIDVTIGTQPHVRVTYARQGRSRTFATDLSARAQQDLQNAMDAEAARPALNKDNPLNIVIRGKWDSDNSKLRWKTLRDFLQSIVPDRKMVAEEVIAENGLYSDRDHFSRNVRRGLPTESLIPTWLEEFQKAVYPDRDGVFLINTAGRTNVRRLADIGAGFMDLSITGASFNDAFPLDPEKGAIYVASLPAGAGVDPAPMKSVPSIFAHELAHALFIPHAFSRSNPAVPVPTPSSKAHVADDTCVMNYDLNSEHFCGLCMIRMRGWNWDPVVDVEYQLVLRLGNPDDLFSTADFEREFGERLQILGLFNRPIGYHDHSACLIFSLEHAENLFPALAGASTVQARAVLAPLTLNYLVEGGALPAPGQFRKIRVPGGFPTIYASAALEARFDEAQQGTAAALPYERYMLEGSNRFAIEQDYFAANPALGKIPIEAQVKMRPKGSSLPWAAAPAAEGAKVFFKLVVPDALPAYVAGAAAHTVCGGTSYHNQVAPVPVSARPSQYLLPRIAGYNPDRTRGPEHMNAHVDVGGRRESPDPPFRKTRADNFAQIPGSAILVRRGDAEVTVGADGLAKLVFEPSRIGGDRYKIKAYVGASAQDEPVSTDYSDETGTMVRWRTQRISANIHQPAALNEGQLPPEYSPGGGLYSPQLRQHLGALENIDLIQIATETAKAFVEVIVEPAALNPVPIGNHIVDFFNTLDSLLVAFPRFNRPSQARLLVGANRYPVGITRQVLIANPARTQFTATLDSHTPEPQTLTIRPTEGGPDTWVARDDDGTGNLTVRGAAQAATVNYATGQVDIQFAPAQAGSFEAFYHPDQYFDFRNLVFFPANSPYLVNLRLPADYNARKAAGKISMVPDGPDPQPSGSAYLRAGLLGPVTAVLMQAMVHCIGLNNGYYPGALIFTARDLDNYNGIWDVGGVRGGKSFGNGVFVFRRADFTSAYFRSLVLHEMSHSFYFQHAPGGGASGARPELHDRGDVCVMSYDTGPQNDGDMCGKCIASLRGMNINAGPFVD